MCPQHCVLVCQHLNMAKWRDSGIIRFVFPSVFFLFLFFFFGGGGGGGGGGARWGDGGFLSMRM